MADWIVLKRGKDILVVEGNELSDMQKITDEGRLARLSRPYDVHHPSRLKGIIQFGLQVARQK